MARVYGDSDGRVQRAADLLRLAVRVPAAGDAFLEMTAGDPALRDAATAYMAAANTRNAAEVAALINKGPTLSGAGVAGCAVCGKTLGKHRVMCKPCAKAVLTDGPERGPRKKDRRVMAKKIKPKKLRKMRQRAVITKGFKAASGVKTTDRGKALHAMWLSAANSYDPGERETARAFLGWS